MDKTPLFRPEAINYQQQRLLGTIILTQTWPSWVLTLGFGVVLCALLAVFFLLGFARRETLSGQWLPENGLIHTRSPQAGVVQKVLAREGDNVQAGEVLFLVSGERQGERGSTQRRVGAALTEQRALLDAEIARARSQAALNQATLTRKLAQTQKQVVQLQAGIDLQQRRAEMAQAAAKRYGGAEYSLVVSREKVDEKRAEAIDQNMRLHAMQREEAALSTEQSALQAELAALPTRTERDIATLQTSLNSLTQTEAENDTRQSWEVRAPRAGRLTALNAEVGLSVSAEQTLASVAPQDSPLQAVLYANSRAAGQLKAGMSAQLRFDALPYQKYGQFQGAVRDVSRSPVPITEASTIDATQPLYRVRVRLNDVAMPAGLVAALKAGTQLQATVTLEHRRFYEWVFEPLMGAKARLDQGVN
jgi:membrane fusion protein